MVKSTIIMHLENSYYPSITRLKFDVMLSGKKINSTFCSPLIFLECGGQLLNLESKAPHFGDQMTNRLVKKKD